MKQFVYSFNSIISVLTPVELSPAAHIRDDDCRLFGETEMKLTKTIVLIKLDRIRK